MAIIMCANCDDMFDGDYHAPTEWKGECICESCAELLVCGTCEASVDEGDLSNDGECTACAYITEKDKREAHADDQYTAMKERQLFGDD